MMENFITEHWILFLKTSLDDEEEIILLSKFNLI